jgi:hypothetical protein
MTRFDAERHFKENFHFVFKMASIHGFSGGSYDLQHMYSRQDLKGPLPLPVIHQDTVIHYLYTNGYTKFIDILKKGGLAGVFNDKQTYNTLIIPEEFPEHLSYYDTKLLLQQHILPRSVDCKFLKSGRLFLDTLGSRIMMDWPFIGGRHIKDVKYAGNATLVFVDGGPISPLP